MKVVIKNEAVKEIPELLTDTEKKRFRREHRWVGESEKIDLDIARMSEESLVKIYDYLDKIANDKKHPDSRSAAMSRNQVKQWQDIKQNPGGNTANKLKNVVSVMKTYIDTTPNKFLFKQLEDGNSVPYLVTDIKYHPPKDYSSAHVTIHRGAHNTYASGGYWGGGRDSGGATISLHDDDYRGKTMGEILKSRGYYLETDKRMAEYEREMTRFMAIRGNDGQQVNVVGKALASGERSWYGESFRPVGRNGVPAKMVVDPNDKVSPVSAVPCMFWSGADEHDDVFDEEELFDVPYHPFVRVFDLEDHVNMRSHVNNISAYQYDKSVGDKLVLDPETKDLLEILVNHAADSFVDIVSGKEGGSIILCAGPPGVGKTLTAEVYSEVMERPLYRVQSSQLGISVSALEKALKEVLQRAEKWGAILLIDEADVYVRSRGIDIEQNAIVGVFLRVLEYYRGVLFMTTNMGTTIDDAIVSRVTARIDYELPAKEQQHELWKILCEQNGVKLSNAELAQVLSNHPQLSGRDIKNMLKLAGRVASAKGEPITAALIKRVAKFKQK